MVSEPAASPPQTAFSSEYLQQNHYERIASDYDAHYNDVWSRRYMRLFAFESMFEGVELDGRNVLEAMCGGGQTTNYLLERNAKVAGLDISPQQAEHFKQRHPKAEVRCGSILNSGIQSDSYDIVSIVGGIHHMPPHINETIDEIHRILKPGGWFCFMEPHSESAVETVRSTWYKYDPLFAKNEAAINMTELRRTFAGKFEFVNEHYKGNVGYLFVLNSMVFRIPPFLKPVYSRIAFSIESILNKILGKRFSCFVIGQWRKSN